jgi:hypothetical protein
MPVDADWTTLAGPGLGSTFALTGGVALRFAFAGVVATTLGGCGDVTGFARPCCVGAVGVGAVGVGAVGVGAVGVAVLGALTAPMPTIVAMAGRGAAPMEGFPAVTGDATGVPAPVTVGLGACAGAARVTGFGAGVPAAALAAGVCAEVGVPGRAGDAGFTAAEVAGPGAPTLAAGAACGTRGVSPVALAVVVGGFGGDAGPPPPA